MSDWRYHAASLSAVLLSLAIGLLLGALYLSPQLEPGLKQSLQSLDARLTKQDKELDQTQVRNESLNFALEQSQYPYERLIKRISPGLLAGYRIALVQTGDRDGLVEEVEQSLQAAGAEVISTTTIQWREVKPEELTVVVKNLADVLAQGGTAVEQGVLRRRSGVSLNGNYDSSCQRVLIVTGFQRETPEEEKPPQAVLEGERALLEAMQEAKLKLDACESFTCDFSMIDLYRRHQVPYLDCADLAFGRLMIPFLILEEQGAYGLKQTADSTAPESVWERLGLP